MATDAEIHTAGVEDSCLSTAAPKNFFGPNRVCGPEIGPERCVLRLIEEQAQHAPGRSAVSYNGGILTYLQLERRANQLARQLQALGVGPDVPVAICVERSLEMFVGILGVLKAGAAYVPLDPAYPPDRIAFILEDTQTPVLLTHHRVPSPPATTARVIYLDEISGDDGVAGPPSAATPDNLAYIIYTSGSTGKPKGVLVTRRNLAASTFARLEFYQEPVKTYLLLSSYAFDSSVAGIFWTLCQGGKLVLPAEKSRQDPAELSRLIAAENISHMLCLPSLYAHILETDLARLAPLRTVIVAGETCPRELVNRHRERLPGAAMFNEYGPTEATVWSTAFDCRAPLVNGRVPIGRPIADTRIYILDESKNSLPIMTPGELYIGGPGVAAGYLNRPELTAERFVPDPFWPEPGARLYRTGDLGRWLPDGTIEFLGRADHQVKIRGYRIEPEEIESVLKQHDAVQEAIVLARNDAKDGDAEELRLVAYLVFRSGHSADEPSLRKFIEVRLPEYMVPSAFVFLDALPHTPNGKVDRRALPAPEPNRPAAPDAFVAPRNDVEQKLADLWAGILNVPRVGIHDNFFQLGGHSLSALRVIGRIREIFHAEIPLRILFETPTIAALADAIARTGQNSAAPAIKKMPRFDAASAAALSGIALEK